MNYDKVIECILGNDEVIKATKYISPKEIIRAVRKTLRSQNRKTRKGENIEIHLTIGKPNFLEREFIKDCLKAKEPFPVKNIQIKMWNPPKKKLERTTNRKG